jgi:hypothetical protein
VKGEGAPTTADRNETGRRHPAPTTVRRPLVSTLDTFGSFARGRTRARRSLASRRRRQARRVCSSPRPRPPPTSQTGTPATLTCRDRCAGRAPSTRARPSHPSGSPPGRRDHHNGQLHSRGSRRTIARPALRALGRPVPAAAPGRGRDAGGASRPHNLSQTSRARCRPGSLTRARILSAGKRVRIAAPLHRPNHGDGRAARPTARRRAGQCRRGGTLVARRRARELSSTRMVVPDRTDTSVLVSVAGGRPAKVASSLGGRAETETALPSNCCHIAHPQASAPGVSASHRAQSREPRAAEDALSPCAQKKA